MRKVQLKNGLLEREHTISILGDSQTEIESAAYYGIPGYKVYGEVLAHRLRLNGCRVKARIFGKGGDTTAQTLGRISNLLHYDTPKIAVIYSGVNDPGSGVAGIATAGSLNAITLANTSSDRNNSYVGNVITLTSGTGSGQSRNIISYNPLNFTATVDSNWVTTPDGTTNYAIAAPSSSQIRDNLQACIKALKYNVKGSAILDGNVSFSSQSELPSDGNIGERYLIMNDTSPTGGCLPNHPTMNPTISGNYSASPKQSVWEFRSNNAGESGWGRVAIVNTPIFSDGVSNIIIVSTNYLNWPAGGDNYNTSNQTGTQYSTYANVRASAKLAATIENVMYCDLYDFQSKLIYGGTFEGENLVSECVQGSGTFHYIPTNQHHSLYGHDTVARAIFQLIKNRNLFKSLE